MANGIYNPPPLNYNTPTYSAMTPAQWQALQVQNKGQWWKNLLSGTGSFFLSGLANSVAGAQYGANNPYMPPPQVGVQPNILLIAAAFAAILILKK